MLLLSCIGDKTVNQCIETTPILRTPLYLSKPVPLIWTLGLRNRLCSHHGIVSTTANMTNIFSITFIRLLFFVMCRAGVTAGMRNRKRNHQNGCNEPNEVPKRVFERNGRNDQNESNKTSNTTYHNGWNKQKVESWGNIIDVCSTIISYLRRELLKKTT